MLWGAIPDRFINIFVQAPNFVPWTYHSFRKPVIPPGWWLTYPSEKYARQLGSLFPIYGKIYKMF